MPTIFDLISEREEELRGRRATLMIELASIEAELSAGEAWRRTVGSRYGTEPPPQVEPQGEARSMKDLIRTSIADEPKTTGEVVASVRLTSGRDVPRNTVTSLVSKLRKENVIRKSPDGRWTIRDPGFDAPRTSRGEG